MHKSALAFGALLVLLLSAALSQPAYAHAVFINGFAAYTVNTTQTLAMNVPNERDDTDYNVDIKVAIPTGWQALSCVPKATWTCTLTLEDGRRVVHFAKTSGNVLDENEVFKYTVHTASTVGSYTFPTVQTYETGEIVRWIGAPGSEEPAPVLGTLAASAPPPPTTPATAPPHTSPTTRRATVTTKPATSVTNPVQNPPGAGVSPPTTREDSSAAITTSIPSGATTTTAATTRTPTTQNSTSKSTRETANDGVTVGKAAPVATSGEDGGLPVAVGVVGVLALATLAAGAGWLVVRARKSAATPGG